MKDRGTYQEKKHYFDSLFTLYGRNPVWEALNDSSLAVYRLHLATTNKPAKLLTQMQALAAERNIEVVYHDKKALSRISKNAKQDQGVAADLMLPNYHDLASYLDKGNLQQPGFYILLDQVTNPQNIGMIIRSVAAGGIAGVIIPRQGTADLGPLVIKASAGTVFKCPIIRAKDSCEVAKTFAEQGADIVVLDAGAEQSLFSYQRELQSANNNNTTTLFVLGNESKGVSDKVRQYATTAVNIPMQNNVESLNVAVTAALIAFLPHYQQ